MLYRLQLEERLAQEAREKRVDDKKGFEERSRGSFNDIRKSPTEDRRRDPVQFILGGDK